MAQHRDLVERDTVGNSSSILSGTDFLPINSLASHTIYISSCEACWHFVRISHWLPLHAWLVDRYERIAPRLRKDTGAEKFLGEPCRGLLGDCDIGSTLLVRAVLVLPENESHLRLNDTWSSPWRTMSPEFGICCHANVVFSVGALARR